MSFRSGRKRSYEILGTVPTDLSHFRSLLRQLGFDLTVIERVNAKIKELQTEFGAFVDWVICSETMSTFAEDLLSSELDEWFKKNPPVDPEPKL